jgi:predicted secreted protein
MAPIQPVLTVLAALALAAPAAAGAKTVTRSDSGKTVTIAQGERLIIRLKECGPCGYSWKFGVTPAKAVLKYLGSTYVEPDTEPGTVGASGTRKVRYQGKGIGTTKLRLDYVSPGGQTDGKFRLTIRVKAS